MRIFWLIVVTILLSGCMMGPNYVRPAVCVPYKYKEKSKHWKIAQPRDNFNRGRWWLLFHNAELNELEDRLNCSNQTVANALAQYEEAYALVNEARAAYYPVVIAAASLTRQKQVNTGVSAATASTSSASGVTTALGSTAGFTTTHSLLFNASWVPDIWGSVRRQVEASKAFAQSSCALLSNARLSAQSSLAQYYFELKGLDRNQQLLDETVVNYKKELQIVKNQYASGTVAQSDIVQAQQQLESAQAAAINNGVNRAIYEHAIAVLIGIPASCFAISHKPIPIYVPSIPVSFPSELLERRPDIASSERLVAQANANIGIAIAAFFPSLSLSAALSQQHQGFVNWLSYPLLNWSIGPQLTQTMFDGGLRIAQLCAAKATYRGTVATYRQTVLAAFQNVEDNLSSLRIYGQQQKVDEKAAADALLAWRLVMNQYKSGIVPFSSVITAQTAYFAAEQTAINVRYLRMSAAVGLITALGGGWNDCGLEDTRQLS